MLISPFSTPSMLSRPDRARKRMSALLCGEGSILSITPGQSILSAEALKKLQTAYLTGNKRRKLQRDGAPSETADRNDERSQDARDTKDVLEQKDVKGDGKEKRAAADSSKEATPCKEDTAGSSKEDNGKDSGKDSSKEARDKEIDEAAYDIARRLVEWSTTFSLVVDLDECGSSMRDSDEEGESAPATASFPNVPLTEAVMARVVADDEEVEEHRENDAQSLAFAELKADFKGDFPVAVAVKEATETLFSPPPLQLTYSLCGDGAATAGDVFDTAFADGDGFTAEVIALPSECANFDDPLAFAADLL